MLYLQIRHCVAHREVKNLSSRTLLPYERWPLLKNDDNHLITEIYKTLSWDNCHLKTAGQKRWESELGRTLSVKECGESSLGLK